MTPLRIAMLACFLGIANIAYAEDDDTLLVIPCTGCHTEAAQLPPIFGRPAGELESTMLDLRSGLRESTVMMRLLQGYSEDEIARLAKILTYIPAERSGLAQ